MGEDRERASLWKLCEREKVSGPFLATTPGGLSEMVEIPETMASYAASLARTT